MKKLILLFLAATFCSLAKAQVQENDSLQIDSIKTEIQVDSIKTKVLKLTQEQKDSLILSISETLDEFAFRSRVLDRYKIYKTENLYNLLKLDTETGRIEQIQWSLDELKEFSVYVNSSDLSWYYNHTGIGTFELYPTQNMYQFILLNKVTGETWHVQWGLEDKKRWIRKIY